MEALWTGQGRNGSDFKGNQSEVNVTGCYQSFSPVLHWPNTNLLLTTLPLTISDYERIGYILHFPTATSNLKLGLNFLQASDNY